MDSAILAAVISAIRDFKRLHGYAPRLDQIAARAHIGKTSAWRAVHELDRQACIEITSPPRARLNYVIKEEPCDQLVGPSRVRDSAA